METWVRRPKTPNRLVLDVTRRCNLRCAMCRTWEAPSRHELTPAELEELMQQLPNLVWLDVTGGEVFLRTDAEQVLTTIADTARALQVLHFPTNGWFTRRIVETTKRLRERTSADLIITVSLDGPPEIHDTMRGRAGSFKRALATFTELRALDGVDVYVGTTITPQNADHVDALGELLKAQVPQFRSREWHWNWLQISGHFFHNATLASETSVRPQQMVREHLRRRGMPHGLVDMMELLFLVNLEFYQRGEASEIVCQALRSTAFISPEGDLYPCHVYDRPLGNIRGRNFAEVWQSRAVLDARADIKRLACGGCFTPCEAYPALAGAPRQTVAATARRALKLVMAPK